MVPPGTFSSHISTLAVSGIFDYGWSIFIEDISDNTVISDT
jgi:hypothetical protein